MGAQVPSSGSQPGSDEEPVLPSVSFSDALTLTVREGHPVQLTARELADLTPAELAKYYKVGGIVGGWVGEVEWGGTHQRGASHVAGCS